MILMRANPLLRLLEQLDPEISSFLGSEMAIASLIAISEPKNSWFQGPPLPVAWAMDIGHIKIITSRAI